MKQNSDTFCDHTVPNILKRHVKTRWKTNTLSKIHYLKRSFFLNVVKRFSHLITRRKWATNPLLNKIILCLVPNLIKFI